MSTPQLIHYNGQINVKLRRPWLGGAAVLASAPPLESRAAQLAGRAGLEYVEPVVPTAALGDAGEFTTRSVSPVPLDELSTWFTVQLRSAPRVDGDELWTKIRELLADPEVEYAEPDAEYRLPEPDEPLVARAAAIRAEAIQDPVWHLRATRALEAWTLIAQANRQPGADVVIAHLDTGFVTSQPAVPSARFVHRGWDFVKNRAEAIDPQEDGFLNQPGHGTGTLCLLAANWEGGGRNYKGVATHARIVPIRIGASVIHVGGKAMARGIRYAVQCGANVVTISMGGLPSRLWAEAVNDAYDAGTVICAAAGNHFRLPFGIRTPTEVVYPARFNRVLAVSGITRAEQRYRFADQMSGNDGPEVDVAAPTPEVEWALPGGEFGPGGGTSTATPQVAGAAALWLSYHAQALSGFAPQERVEACRYALIHGAVDAGSYGYRPVPGNPPRTRNDYFGDGRLNVEGALRIPPVRGLPITPRDDVSWALLRILGIDVRASVGHENLGDQVELLWTMHSLCTDVRSRDAIETLASPRLKTVLDGL